jgi:hypothetical protein
MSLKLVGGAAVVLGILLALVALAQPATVTDSATACVDNPSLGRDCSTLTYDRPNYGRSSLFGGGIFLVVAGLVIYGVGASRSPARDDLDNTVFEGGSASRTDRAAPPTHADGASSTLRQQLATRKARRESATDVAADPSTEPSPPPGADPARRDDSVGRDDSPGATDGAATAEDERLLGPAAVASVSALASAFVLSWLFGLVVTVGSLALRTVAFVLLALPGVLCYRWFVTLPTDADADPPAVSDR